MVIINTSIRADLIKAIQHIILMVKFNQFNKMYCPWYTQIVKSVLNILQVNVIDSDLNSIGWQYSDSVIINVAKSPIFNDIQKEIGQRQ